MAIQVAKATCAKWINDVSYFNGCEEDFIIRLSLSLVPETYTPQEKLISLGEESSHMYVVRQGVVASEGRISISGGVIGIDMLTNLYISSELIRNYEAIALTFSNVMRCDKDIVLAILDKFPNTSATLRRTVIRRVPIPRTSDLLHSAHVPLSCICLPSSSSSSSSSSSPSPSPSPSP